MSEGQYQLMCEIFCMAVRLQCSHESESRVSCIGVWMLVCTKAVFLFTGTDEYLAKYNHPPDQLHPLRQRSAPWGKSMLGDMANNTVVCILLECISAINHFTKIFTFQMLQRKRLCVENFWKKTIHTIIQRVLKLRNGIYVFISVFNKF